MAENIGGTGGTTANLETLQEIAIGFIFDPIEDGLSPLDPDKSDLIEL